MPDGSTPGAPVSHRVDPGDDGLEYARTWTDSTGDVTLWLDPDWGPTTPASGAPVTVQPGGIVTGTYVGPSVYSATLSPTASGAILEVVREGGCSLLFEFGSSEGTGGTTLTLATLGPLVADWLDAWNLYAATTVSLVGTTMCFRFDPVSQEQPCVPVGGSEPTDSAADPVVVAIANDPLGEVPVNLVAGVVTAPSFAPSPMFPLGGVDEFLAGDPRRFVWGLVSPRLCETGAVSSDLFLSTVCTPGAQGPDDPVIPPERFGMAVGIDDAGDAVLLRPDGTSTVLFDGTEPGSTAVEGDLAFVDHVSLSPDGSRAVVSTCCEPLSGSFHVIDTSTLQQIGSGLGHMAEYTRSGDLIVVSGDGVSYIDGDTFGFAAYLLEMPVDAPYSVADLAVIGDTVLAITIDALPGPDGSVPVRLHRLNVGGGDMQISVELERFERHPQLAPTPRLVGTTAWLFVTDSSGALRVFDLDTLAEIADASEGFGETPLWKGNQVVTVTVSGDTTTLGFEDTFVSFPGLRLTFARF